MRRLIGLVMAAFVVVFAQDSFVNAGTDAFRDIDHSFAKSEIVELFNKKVIDGTEPGLFEPTKPVSRAEFVKMLAGVLLLEPVTNSIPVFQDFTRSDWYYGWVYAAVDLGMVDGKSETSFAPNDTITREEAAAILARAVKKSPSSQVYPYQDEATVSPWALPYVGAVTQAGLMEGYEQSFYPHKNLTREEAAMILKRVSDKLQAGIPAKPPIQIGWQYGGTDSEYKQKILNSNVNVISPRWFFLEKDGKISNDADADMVKWAHDNQKKVWPLVGNHFDPATTHLFLTTNKENALLQLTTLVTQNQLDGLNLDFENIDPKDRDLLTQFVADLGSRMRTAGKSLSIDVPPDLQTDWSQPFDFAALSQKADYLVVMDYEEHWYGSDNKGSVASLPWFVSGVEQLIKETASANIVVGAPLYGRDWWMEAGKLQSEDKMLQDEERMFPAFTSVKWDPSVGQYTAETIMNGVTHNMWLEDSRSLALKYRQMLNDHVAGFAYWYIASETDDIWAAFRNEDRYHSYQF